MPSDFGDWGNTDSGKRKELEQYCLRPLCGHIRWAHGTMWWAATNHAAVAHTAGACSVKSCSCETFTDNVPLSQDDVMDMAALLGDDDKKITLEGIGIGDLASLQCRAWVTRHIGGEAINRRCGKELGHKSDHDW